MYNACDILASRWPMVVIAQFHRWLPASHTAALHRQVMKTSSFLQQSHHLLLLLRYRARRANIRVRRLRSRRHAALLLGRRLASRPDAVRNEDDGCDEGVRKERATIEEEYLMRLVKFPLGRDEIVDTRNCLEFVVL